MGEIFCHFSFFLIYRYIFVLIIIENVLLVNRPDGIFLKKIQKNPVWNFSVAPAPGFCEFRLHEFTAISFCDYIIPLSCKCNPFSVRIM